jgi:hypothetical protein
MGRCELGHLRGDAVVDVPLPPEWRDQVAPDALPPERRPSHDPSWASVALQTEEDVQHALALLRGNYEANANRAVDA